MPERRINPLATDVMSVAEAARRTQLSPTTVKRGIVAGTFPGHKIESRYIVPREWFARWLAGEWVTEERKSA